MYRIKEEVFNNNGKVFFLQKKWLFWWFTDKTVELDYSSQVVVIPRQYDSYGEITEHLKEIEGCKLKETNYHYL